MATIMKKTLICAIASGMLSLSGHSLANVAEQVAISAGNVSGLPGAQVQLDVSLTSGSFEFGGNFLISFDSSRLSYFDAQGTTGDLMALAISNTPGLVELSLANIGGPLTPVSGLFSIWFDIAAPYPSAILPEDVTVTIAEGTFDPSPSTFATISPLVTVLQRQQGAVPEPGTLGLMGLGLAVMGQFYRKRRVA